MNSEINIIFSLIKKGNFIEAKKLLKFCGLPWDIRCLEFYKRKDLISKTQSNVQIRKTIYKDSINKYLPYKQFLSKHGNKYSWFN